MIGAAHMSKESARRWRAANVDRARTYQRERASHPNQAESRARAALRRNARQQAAETRENVIEIYARWGCLTVAEEQARAGA